MEIGMLQSGIGVTLTAIIIRIIRLQWKNKNLIKPNKNLLAYLWIIINEQHLDREGK